MSGPRLPIAGGTAADTQSLAPGPIQPLEQRVAAPLPVIAVVSARARASHEMRFARVMAEELARGGTKVAALIARTAVDEGFDVREDTRAEGDGAKLRAAGASLVVTLRAHPAVVPEGVAAALSKVHERGAEIVITVGAVVPAIVQTRLCVMITGGLSPALWDLSARALRDRLDLELADPREGVARKLAAALGAPA